MMPQQMMGPPIMPMEPVMSLGPPMMPYNPQQMMGPPIMPMEPVMPLGPPLMPMGPQQMMGPPIMPGQFQGGYGYGQSQFGYFDETNDDPQSPENQPPPSPGPSRRSANTNVQSGIKINLLFINIKFNFHN